MQPHRSGGSDRINAVMHTPREAPGYLPIAFGQRPDVTTTITTATDATATYAFVSATAGKELPAEVNALNTSAKVTNLTVVKAREVPADYADVKVSDGVWKFQGWNKGGIAWNDDPTVTADCKIAHHVGAWTFEASPSEKVTPDAQPTTSNVTLSGNETAAAPLKPAKKILAHTGAEVAGLVALAGVMVGAGALLVRRRKH